MVSMLVWPGLSSRKHEPLTLRGAVNSEASCPFFLLSVSFCGQGSSQFIPSNVRPPACGNSRAGEIRRSRTLRQKSRSQRNFKTASFSWHHDIYHIIFHYLDQNAVAAIRLLANVDHVPRVGPRLHPLSAMSVADVVFWQTLHRQPESRKPRMFLNILRSTRSKAVDFD